MATGMDIILDTDRHLALQKPGNLHPTKEIFQGSLKYREHGTRTLKCSLEPDFIKILPR